MNKPLQILGTWRLITYETWNAEGEVTEPLGTSPVGFAVFDDTGHAFIQLARRTGQDKSAEAIDAAAHSFVAYFGTLTINEEHTELTVAVDASNLPRYVGSRQVRPFKVTDDTLVLGVPGQYRATLHRVSA